MHHADCKFYNFGYCRLRVEETADGELRSNPCAVPPREDASQCAGYQPIPPPYSACRHYDGWSCKRSKQGCALAIEYVTRGGLPDGSQCEHFTPKDG